MLLQPFIEVQFTVRGAVIKGVITHDHARRTKCVFIHRYVVGEPAPFGVQLPNDGEVWSCSVVRDTNPKDRTRGVLVISLVMLAHERSPTQMADAYLLRSGEKLRIIPSTDRLLQLIPAPVAQWLPELAEKIEVPELSGRYRFAVEIDMERVVGIDPVVCTPKISVHDQAQFAMLPHHTYPMRTVQDREGVETTRLTLVLVKKIDEPEIIFLRMVYVGRMVPPTPRPKGAPRGREDSLPFWCEHAFVYDARFAGSKVFTSTWARVMGLPAQKEVFENGELNIADRCCP